MVGVPLTYVTGHRNPDTDSIAAAIGYAELRSLQDPDTTYLPVRLGDLNAQTRWVLDQAGAAEPDLLPHIMLRVRDVMAQDFYAAFGLGENELMINSVDIDGVNLAAIHALTARTDALQAENATLKQENADLRARVERIEAMLAGQGTIPAQP